MKTLKGLLIPTVWCALLAMTGCGDGTNNPATHAVEGTVMYLDRPLPDVAITFYPAQGRSAVGKADKDGNFSMMTFNPNDGAVAGTHKVTILLPGAPVSDELNASDYGPPKTSKGPAPFPLKYNKPETTPLTVKIPEDLEGGKLTLKLQD
ncbi:hypothetical protein Pan44_04130 [Caulifigura coniformis]|uniref:Carboxypeptidase regulatory-like domain-containing protein n=1 Tax=Caulifigura coniformis TaxID=2527983 RepID=A0A517S8F9_9PLAN|nr:hypothetical protein [Caulifigura coniformis]QDT52402.1 hypothetical protein Pan44_04130 [Caulifigura coniformis]